MIWQLNVKYSDSFVEKISCLIHYNGLSEHHSSDKHSTCGLIMDTYPLWWLSVIWGGGGAFRRVSMELIQAYGFISCF